MNTTLLQVEQLCAWYERAQVLFTVDLRIEPGEVVALLGRNGAGKSTTLKSLMGLLRSTTGHIHWQEQAIERLPSHQIAHLGIGYVPEDRRIFTELSVRENLEVGRRAPADGSAPLWDEARVSTLFPNLRELLDRPAGRISGGEQQMLTVARTLMGHPQLLLLDEPSEGLAPVIVAQLSQAVTALKHQGISILLSEQNLGFALQVCDRVYIMESGQIRYQGSRAELQENPDIRQRYLGV
jgi:branched-chain amino acid transport system ATP-binding protein